MDEAALLIGERIRNRRLQMGLTQADIAGEDLSVGFISLIESGKREPSDRALQRILQSLQVSREELFAQEVFLFDVRDLALQKQVDVAIARNDALAALDVWHKLSTGLQTSVLGQTQRAQIHELNSEWRQVVEMSEQNLYICIRESRWHVAATNLKMFGRATTRLGMSSTNSAVLNKVAELTAANEFVDQLFETQLRIMQGHAAIDAGDGNTALIAYDSALRNLPADADIETRMSVLWGLSSAYATAGQHNAAFDAAEQAATLLTDNSYIYQHSTLVWYAVAMLRHLDDPDKSRVAQIKKVVTDARNNPALQNNKLAFVAIEFATAEMLMFETKAAEALKILTKMSDHDIDYKELTAWKLVLIAECLETLKKPTESLANVREALDLVADVDWNFGLRDTLIHSARLLSRLGQHEESNAVLLKIVEIKPTQLS